MKKSVILEDEYPSYNRPEPEVGPVTAFFRFMGGLLTKTPAPDTSEKKEYINVQSTAFPIERNISFSRETTPRIVEAPVTENSTKVLKRRADVTLNRFPEKNISFIKYNENKSEIIDEIAINMAGPNETPKMVTVSSAAQYEHLCATLSFLQNHVLEQPKKDDVHLKISKSESTLSATA